ncbi:TPA: hypothetical protein ACNADN_005220 [Klebsiella pneumoniae]
MLIAIIVLTVLLVLLFIDRQKVAKELSNRHHQVMRLKGEINRSEGLREYAEKNLAVYDAEHSEIIIALNKNDNYDFHRLRNELKEITDRRFNERHSINLEFK